MTVYVITDVLENGILEEKSRCLACGSLGANSNGTTSNVAMHSVEQNRRYVCARLFQRLMYLRGAVRKPTTQCFYTSGIMFMIWTQLSIDMLSKKATSTIWWVLGPLG